MNIATVLLIGALIYTLTGLYKMVEAKNWSGVRTQVAAFAIGLAVVFLASASEVVGTWDLNGTPLNDMDFATKLFVGLLASSLFGAFNDLTAAIDQTRSSNKSKEPPLP